MTFVRGRRISIVIGIAIVWQLIWPVTGRSAHQEPPQGRPRQEGQPGFGPPGGGPPGFGPGGMMGAERKLVEKYDTNNDGWLNAEERAEARKSEPARGGPPEGGPRGGRRGGPPLGGPPGDFPPLDGPRGGGPPLGGPFGGFPPGGGPGGETRDPPKEGKKISPTDVQPATGDLYDPSVLRTLFLTFENADWEKELEAFNNTDVEVPATLVVDGETYPDVGIHFRGASSFGMVPTGYKRSLNLSLDFLNEDQRLLGYKTLNLLNSNTDPSFMHTVLYFDIARNYLPAPKANFVRVVINGEDWGLYVNAQQFNKEFVNDFFPNSKGVRWKVPGRPNGRGGLEFLGDEIEAYRQIYEIKSQDKPKSWQKLIELCRVLNETPIDELESALEPMLDIDSTLKFLALELAMINSDGYWVRASDYSLFLDDAGKFHVIPHDANETLQVGMGPGMRGNPPPGGRGRGTPPPSGPGGGNPPPGGLSGNLPPGGPPNLPPENGSGLQQPQDPQTERRPQGGQRGGQRGRGGPGGVGLQLDPLIGLDDPNKPLRSRLLQVPKLQKQYLEYVRQIAEVDLDWKNLKPRVDQYAELIAPVLQEDTKKLSSYEDFLAVTSQRSELSDDQANSVSGPQPRGRMSLEQFSVQRRKFLLDHAAIKKLDE